MKCSRAFTALALVTMKERAVDGPRLTRDQNEKDDPKWNTDMTMFSFLVKIHCTVQAISILTLCSLGLILWLLREKIHGENVVRIDSFIWNEMRAVSRSVSQIMKNACKCTLSEILSQFDHLFMQRLWMKKVIRWQLCVITLDEAESDHIDAIRKTIWKVFSHPVHIYTHIGNTDSICCLILKMLCYSSKWLPKLHSKYITMTASIAIRRNYL